MEVDVFLKKTFLIKHTYNCVVFILLKRSGKCTRSTDKKNYRVPYMNFYIYVTWHIHGHVIDDFLTGTN